MKIIFSDYDGTIKTFLNNPNIFERIKFEKNLKSIPIINILGIMGFPMNKK